MSREGRCAVRFLDAFAQATWITRAEILAASKGLVPRDILASLLDLADDGAQSPVETAMRLIVRDLLPEPYRWQSQVRVDLLPDAHRGWTPRTLPDLGCPELKIALYYDGGHHSEGAQTEVDFNQFHALRDRPGVGGDPVHQVPSALAGRHAGTRREGDQECTAEPLTPGATRFTSPHAPLRTSRRHRCASTGWFQRRRPPSRRAPHPGRGRGRCGWGNRSGEITPPGRPGTTR